MLQETFDVISLLSDLGSIGLLITGVYLGLTGRVVSRFQYDEMKQAYKTQIEYWRRKCGGGGAEGNPTYGGDDS